VTQLAEQYRSEVKKHQETINRLNETGWDCRNDIIWK
jgi:hypothetical protein